MTSWILVSRSGSTGLGRLGTVNQVKKNDTTTYMSMMMMMTDVGTYMPMMTTERPEHILEQLLTPLHDHSPVPAVQLLAQQPDLFFVHLRLRHVHASRAEH